MADYFSTSPNFVNPAYATPEQLANQRAYADALMKRGGEDVKHPAGALANALLSLSGGLERNRANALQSEAATANGQNMSELISQLQNGQRIDPQNLGHMVANPMVSPEQRALALELMRPKAVEDSRGRPGFSSAVQGVQAAPVQGLFEPGIRAPESAGSVSTVTPMPAPMARPQLDAVSPQGGIFGGMNSSPVGWNTPSGSTPGAGQASGAVPPAAPAPASPTFNERYASRIPQLAAMDRELTAEKERTQGGAKAEGDVIQKDVTRAAAAPETLKGLGIMKNTIETVGDKMTFGPTAKFSNEARRVIANYAPGAIDEKGLAGADAIEKLNLGLAGTLSQSLGLNPSDIYRSVASVPGNEKSKSGTLALINMMEQAARNDQYVGTTLYQQNRGNLAAYQQAREAYYSTHPIVNPITGNPVEIDAKKAASGGGYEKTATNPQTGAKMGLRNGKWEPIQ